VSSCSSLPYWRGLGRAECLGIGWVFLGLLGLGVWARGCGFNGLWVRRRASFHAWFGLSFGGGFLGWTASPASCYDCVGCGSGLGRGKLFVCSGRLFWSGVNGVSGWRDLVPGSGDGLGLIDLACQVDCLGIAPPVGLIGGVCWDLPSFGALLLTDIHERANKKRIQMVRLA